MNNSFWDQLPKPFFTLAPMYDVTDSAFRQIISRRGSPRRGGAGPAVFYTEFVSADGLCSVGRDKLLRELYFTDRERPIVAQIFGANPENIYTAAKLIKELRPAGLDINLGCPERNVVKAGACAALIKNPKLAQEIILAAKAGAGELPVSVKTRIGFSAVSELENWAETLLEVKPAAIAWHLRTKKEESKAPAHWEVVPEIKKIFSGSGIILMANGDVKDLKEAREKAEKYDLDGVMLGRAVFGNPWLFADLAQPPSTQEKLEVLLEHTKLFTELYRPGPTNTKLFNGHTKNFAVMKKHFKAYVGGFSGASELRDKLYAAETAEAVCAIIEECQK